MSSTSCAGSSMGRKSVMGCSTSLSKTWKSSRRRPEMTWPAESVTLTPTLTRLTATRMGGDCGVWACDATVVTKRSAAVTSLRCKRIFASGLRGLQRSLRPGVVGTKERKEQDEKRKYVRTRGSHQVLPGEIILSEANM